MSIIQSIILGVVQGITEFLPISSSGHLVVFQKIFGLKEAPVFFDALLHAGTLLAIVLYFKKEIVNIIKNFWEKGTQRLVLNILIGTVPVVVVGFLIKDKVGEMFNSLLLTGISFLITALLLWLTYFFKKQTKSINDLTWVDSLFIGVFQAISIIPAISRSGATIAAGIYRKIDRESAFKFSFLLAIPALLGAFILQLFQGGVNVLESSFASYIIGFLVAIIIGLVSLKILEKILVRGKFSYFAVYCFVLGVVIILIK